MKTKRNALFASLGLLFATVCLSSCAGEGDFKKVDNPKLVSLVVWLKGGGALGGSLWGMSLAGDLATGTQGELLPPSTAKRLTPHLSKPEGPHNEAALFWVIQGGGTSVVHRYVVGDTGESADEIVVSDGAFASGPASDSPQKVYYSSNVAGTSDIYRKTGTTGAVRLTTTGSNFSPDVAGSAMVYSNNIGNFEVYRASSEDGSSPTNLTNDPSADINPRFSRDGSKVVFASNRSGRYNIYMMNADGSGLERLTSHSADDATPSFSADMKYVVFASKLDGDWDIYALDLATRALTNLTDDNVEDRSPHCGEFRAPD